MRSSRYCRYQHYPRTHFSSISLGLHSKNGDYVFLIHSALDDVRYGSEPTGGAHDARSSVMVRRNNFSLTMNEVKDVIQINECEYEI